VNRAIVKDQNEIFIVVVQQSYRVDPRERRWSRLLKSGNAGGENKNVGEIAKSGED